MFQEEWTDLTLVRAERAPDASHDLADGSSPARRWIPGGFVDVTEDGSRSEYLPLDDDYWAKVGRKLHFLAADLFAVPDVPRPVALAARLGVRCVAATGEASSNSGGMTPCEARPARMRSRISSGALTMRCRRLPVYLSTGCGEFDSMKWFSMTIRLRGGAMEKGVFGIVCVAVLMLSSCKYGGFGDELLSKVALNMLDRSGGPCASGEELRETPQAGWNNPRSRGCVDKYANGKYRAQGRWVFFYRDGSKEAEGNYRNSFMGDERGLTFISEEGRDGRWLVWYENGQKKAETTYDDGKPTGLATRWHENGQKEFEGTWVDGKLNGTVTNWYKNGQKESEGTSVDGKLNGLSTNWYENGQKASESTWADGKLNGLATSWYENGQKESESNWVDGKPNGRVTNWYENGQKKDTDASSTASSGE
jgi:antitoxin component YwqK of YwqJK toxin-antitoxin module